MRLLAPTRALLGFVPIAQSRPNRNQLIYGWLCIFYLINQDAFVRHRLSSGPWRGRARRAREADNVRVLTLRGPVGPIRKDRRVVSPVGRFNPYLRLVLDGGPTTCPRQSHN